ncbi:hypothetical protein ACHAXA_005504 [Cyclostephanos tholiformis]|uniref:Uncharacterized protein n=1 Tax=Cyclostephanos tholiformis TaxID=382380 RepID=A0ABD3RVC0_9STRA
MTNPTRALLLKVAKSITAEATLAMKDSAKAAAAAAVSASANAVSAQQPPSSTPPSTPPPYALLHHHKNPKLLQYRHPGSFSYLAHHISSAIDAVISLCLSQEARDRFLSLTTAPPEVDTEDDGRLVGSVINTRVLGQSDMGFLKSLTLYEELGNPLLQKNHKFNIREFLDGCGWALEQFHREKDALFPTLKKVIDATLEARQKALEHGVEDNEKSESEDISSELIERVRDIASNNPDSVNGRSSLQDMTTPETMNVILWELLAPIATFSMAKVQTVDCADKFRDYHDMMMVINDDTKVMNVALLSARVEEVYPPSPSAEQTMLQKKNDDPDAPLEDGSLIPHRQRICTEEEESKAQVITQLEVLYELQQSSVNNEGKTKTRTSLMVGKFEGCLDGDPNGDELRWKLASYRHAVEFFNI